MALDISGALRAGVDRVASRNGLVLLAAFYVLQLLNTSLSGAATAETLEGIQDAPGFGPGMGPGGEPFPGVTEPSPLAAPLPPAVASLLGLVVTFATLALTIVAIRTFVGRYAEEIPGEFWTRNIVWGTINLFVGFIVFGFLVAIGFVLLIIPGFFLLVSLFFFSYEVAAEDKNFLSGMGDAWRLAKGDRLRLFVLGFLVIVADIVVAIAIGIVAGPLALVSPILGALVGGVTSAVVAVFNVAVGSHAYDQLRTEKRGSGAASAEGGAGAGTTPTD